MTTLLTDQKKKIQKLQWLNSIEAHKLTPKIIIQKKELNDWYRNEYKKRNKEGAFFCEVADALI